MRRSQADKDWYQFDVHLYGKRVYAVAADEEKGEVTLLVTDMDGRPLRDPLDQQVTAVVKGDVELRPWPSVRAGG